MNTTKNKTTKPKEFDAKSYIASVVNEAVGRGVKYTLVDYDTTQSRDCAGAGCDYICRCSQISNVEIIPLKFGPDIYARSVVENIFKKGKAKLNLKVNKRIAEYCISRAIRNTGISSAENYFASISQGYYGQEVDSIYLDWLCSAQLSKATNDVLFSNSDLGAVHLALEGEYGYLTEKVKLGKKAVLETVEFKDLVAPNLEYPKRLDVETIKLYEEKFDNSYYDDSYIIGVYFDDGGKKRIIDGYHRYFASKNIFKPNKKLNIITIY